MSCAEPERGEALRGPIDQGIDAKLLGEALQLAGRGATDLKIDEVRLDPTFREEPKCFARVRALLGAEDLHLQVGTGHGEEAITAGQ